MSSVPTLAPVTASKLDHASTASHSSIYNCTQVLPPWLTTVLLSALLALLSSKLIHRGVLTYRSETKALALAARENEELNAALEAPLLEGAPPVWSAALLTGKIQQTRVNFAAQQGCLLLC